MFKKLSFVLVTVLLLVFTGCGLNKMNGPVAVTDDGDAVFSGDSRLDKLDEDMKTELEYVHYVNTDRGIEFDYPKNWILEESDTEGVLYVSVANMVAPEGYGCTENYVSMTFMATVRDIEQNKSFDEWFKSNYSPDAASLGGYGGELEKMEFSGHSAYKVGDFGWETYCPSHGYVIDYSNEDAADPIIDIVISKNPDYLYGDIIINKMIDSVVLKGF